MSAANRAAAFHFHEAGAAHEAEDLGIAAAAQPIHDALLGLQDTERKLIEKTEAFYNYVNKVAAVFETLREQSTTVHLKSDF